MSLVVVEVTVTIADPSTRQALLEKSVPNQMKTRNDEPGCLAYCWAADPCQEDVIQVYELWESEETLAAHLVHPNYFEMRELMGAGGLVSAVSRKHRIDASAPVYGPDHVATASFD